MEGQQWIDETLSVIALKRVRKSVLKVIKKIDRG